MKSCVVCSHEIPSDFVNNLCLGCYEKIAAQNALREEIDQKEREKDFPPPKPPENEVLEQEIASQRPVLGVSDPNYKENPEMEDKEQWMANLALFQRHGKLIWNPTRDIYRVIKDFCLEKTKSHVQFSKHIWQPMVVDVGCGAGVGSNYISQEASFVWGIDKNKKSIDFAKEAFERVKNGIYYSSQVTFDHIDILEDTRTFMQFDVVVAIEIIEHVYDYKKFLSVITKKLAKPTSIFFISTPNRNNRHISKERPHNKYHVREFTSEEFHAALSEFFVEIKFFNSKGVPIEGYTTDHTPLLAKCEGLK